MRNKLRDISIPINLISTYRTELMGLAILGVMWGHLMNETWQPVIFSQLARLIHTAGFIFLSGFGLYYAFQKNKNTKSFYKKRLIRIITPFVFITYWFFITAYACGEESLLQFIADLTTTRFWIYGEAHSWAMWYVSATVLLYLLFPLIYRTLFIGKKTIYGLSVITILYIMALWTIAQLYPAYWINTRIFWARLIMFPLGIFSGHLAYQSKAASLIQIVIYFIGCSLLAIIAKLWIDDEIYAVARTLIGLPLVTILLYYLAKLNWTSNLVFKPLQFLGIHSYELYLIHVIIFYFCKNIIELQSSVSMIIGIFVALVLCRPIHNRINHLIPSKK